MALPEVLDIFNDYTTPQNIPLHFIDLEHVRLVDINAVKSACQDTISSIGEAEIERHTSYANQRREDVIRMIIKGVVKYATLSHTRVDAEVSYDDLVIGVRSSGPGWDKLRRFCDIARDTFKCRFAWTDAACIDHEKINESQSASQFLFSWFRNAYVCIAYLVQASDPSDMKHERWFYRGFTLTELLAPTRSKFYGKGWKALNNDYIENDRADESFLKSLSNASGIHIDDLRIFWPGPERVRDKMSWASKRQTLKVEDTAYSLIPLFNSRIQLCYGEGERAFTRLMIDIIPKSGECDAFAWAGPCSEYHPGLPRSPAGFGEKHRDWRLNPTPHHYRLCGDRLVSVDPDYLRIRVILLEVPFPQDVTENFQSRLLDHPASISEVTLLDHQDFVTHSAGARMAVGVIDYGWTDNADEGTLRKGEIYFCFLLYRSAEKESWKKLQTQKVVFLTNEEDLVQGLEMLILR